MPGNLNRGLQYAHIGLAIPGCTIAGLLLGMALDRWLGTTWLYLAGLLLGIVAGFYEIIRAVKQMNPPTAPAPDRESARE